MKKNLMLFAAAAAAFGLLTVTGCEDNAGNEENNGEETTDISINKLWCAELTVEGQTMTYCLDMGAAHEDTFVLGIGGMDSDSNVYISFDNGYSIKSITPTDETSGTIIVGFINEDGTTGEDEEISYSDLTEDSVTITTKLADTMSGMVSEVTYECTLAPEGTKVYTYAEYMAAQTPSEDE